MVYEYDLLCNFKYTPHDLFGVYLKFTLTLTLTLTQIVSQLVN